MVVDIFGWCLVVVDGDRWWWMVVDIFWLVVGAGLIIFSNPFKSTYRVPAATVCKKNYE